MLVELRLDHPKGESRRDHLVDVDLAQDVGQGADVVLVRVGEDDRAHAPAVQVAEVGQQDVHAQVLVTREGEPGIDDDGVLAGLVDRHVLADLAEAAEGDDAECGVGHRAAV